MDYLSFDKPSIYVKVPPSSQGSVKSAKGWLERKKNNDDAEGLWRVHDKLYDLISFVERHPGGKDWIDLTQGTDITELFETHHIRGKAELLLNSFYVREAKMPRNYKFTFIDGGFYKTLRRKIADQLSVLQERPKKKSNVIRFRKTKIPFSFAMLSDHLRLASYHHVFLGRLRRSIQQQLNRNFCRNLTSVSRSC